jgi:hypothetical protein
MRSQHWKRHEREIAALLGGIRWPNSGRAQPDALTDRLAVHVKTTKALPTWLHAALDQVARDCDAERIPVVMLYEASQVRRTRRILCFDLDCLYQQPALPEPEKKDSL